MTSILDSRAKVIDLSPEESIALICLTAHRSSISTQELVKAGFTKVYNIAGGMMAWKKAHKVAFERCLNSLTLK